MKGLMRTRTAIATIVAPALVLLTIGCQHVVYVSDTTVGVDLTLAAQGTPKLVFGYDRETYALVPRFDDGTTSEAMSLVSVSNVDSTGLDELIFNHYIATGKAADEAVKNPQGLYWFRKIVQMPAGQ